MQRFWGKYRDSVIGVLFILLALGVYLASFSIRELVHIQVGPRFVPRLAAGALALFSAILILQNIVMQRRIAARLGKEVVPVPEDSADESPRPGGENAVDRRAVVSTILLLVAYVALLWLTGFVLTTTVYLFLQFLVLTPKQNRRYWLFAVVALSTAFGVNYLFVSGFRLMLPSGIVW